MLWPRYAPQARENIMGIHANLHVALSQSLYACRHISTNKIGRCYQTFQYNMGIHTALLQLSYYINKNTSKIHPQLILTVKLYAKYLLDYMYAVFITMSATV